MIFFRIKLNNIFKFFNENQLCQTRTIVWLYNQGWVYDMGGEVSATSVLNHGLKNLHEII